MTSTKMLAFLAILSLGIQGAFAMDTIRIQSLRSGVIKVDGQPVTLNGLAEALSHIKSRKGGVLYYREAPDQQPTEHQNETFKAIVSAGIPISMSSKPDFSDSIGPDGRSHPRNQR